MDLHQDKQIWAECIEKYKKRYENSPVTSNVKHKPITVDDILSRL